MDLLIWLNIHTLKDIQNSSGLGLMLTFAYKVLHEYEFSFWK